MAEAQRSTQLISGSECLDTDLIEALSDEGALDASDAVAYEFPLAGQRRGILVSSLGDRIDSIMIRELCGHNTSAVTVRLHSAFTIQGLALMAIADLKLLGSASSNHIFGAGEAGSVAYEIAVQLLGADVPVSGISLMGPSASEALQASSEFASTSVTNDRLASLVAAYRPLPLPKHLSARWVEIDSTPNAPQIDTGRGTLPLPFAACLRLNDLDLSDGQRAAQGLARAMIPTAPIVRPSPPTGSLMCLQTGTGPSSLYCIPGAGASIVDFVPLSTHMGRSVALHAFQPRGLDGEQLPRTTVEATARAYVRELQASCPRGDVHLVGHSFGAWIAFEMALQMQAAGRPPARLTLIDSEPPGIHTRIGREYGRVDALCELVALYEEASQQDMRLSRADFEKSAATDHMQLLHSRMIAAGLLPPRSSSELLKGTIACFEAALRTRYQPATQYQGTVQLILASGRSASGTSRRLPNDVLTSGWAALVDRLSTHVTSGNHMTMLDAPHVQAIATLLSSAPVDTLTHVATAS